MTDELDVDDNQPVYYFSGGMNENVEPTVEVVKSWKGGQQRRTLGAYDSIQTAFEVEREMVEMKQDEGLEPAMNAAERMAVQYGTLDPARPDGRMFTDGPPDTFTTEREHELETLRYSYETVEQATGTFELQSVKTWKDDQGVGMQAITLGEYDRPADARLEQEMLRRVRDFQGLEAEMRTVEQIAVENGTLQADRVDPRLFTDGPPDPFTTNREAELEASLGYTFRAGPVPDPEVTDEYSLDLVSVERQAGQYQFSAAEFVRVSEKDARFVADASEKFNRIIADEGTGPAVQAATTWSQMLGSQPSRHWQHIDAEMLDRRVTLDVYNQSRAVDIDADTERMVREQDMDL